MDTSAISSINQIPHSDSDNNSCWRVNNGNLNRHSQDLYVVQKCDYPGSNNNDNIPFSCENVTSATAVDCLCLFVTHEDAWKAACESAQAYSSVAVAAGSSSTAIGNNNSNTPSGCRTILLPRSASTATSNPSCYGIVANHRALFWVRKVSVTCVPDDGCNKDDNGGCHQNQPNSSTATLGAYAIVVNGSLLGGHRTNGPLSAATAATAGVATTSSAIVQREVLEWRIFATPGWMPGKAAHARAWQRLLAVLTTVPSSSTTAFLSSRTCAVPTTASNQRTTTVQWIPLQPPSSSSTVPATGTGNGNQGNSNSHHNCSTCWWNHWPTSTRHQGNIMMQVRQTLANWHAPSVDDGWVKRHTPNHLHDYILPATKRQCRRQHYQLDSTHKDCNNMLMEQQYQDGRDQDHHMTLAVAAAIHRNSCNSSNNHSKWSYRYSSMTWAPDSAHHPDPSSSLLDTSSTAAAVPSSSSSSSMETDLFRSFMA